MADPSFRTVQDIYEYLLTFVNAEKGQAVEFKLDRMRDLARRLGNPQTASPCVHVAGSKGKGSVATMVAHILEAAGKKTGLYTSPHILDFRERITRAGEFFPDGAYRDAMEELAPLVIGAEPGRFVGNELPTFFELATLLAFLVYRGQGCEAAVYEVGLGGRLDSTNIVCPEASIITVIELEHSEYLGTTIPEIAGEKAGIIKPGVPTFTGSRDPQALEVFRRIAAERKSLLRILSEEVILRELRITRSGTEVTASFRDREVFPEPVRLHTPLIGEAQAENAALAALAARLSSFRPSPEAVLEGISRASLPARFQILPGEPPVVLDGAHTPASMTYTARTFQSLFPGPAVLVLACAEDKRPAEMARALSAQFRKAIVTRPGTFKKSDPEATADAVRTEGFEVDLVPDTVEALRLGMERARSEGTPLLVTGSFYLCAAALNAFRETLS